MSETSPHQPPSLVGYFTYPNWFSPPTVFLFNSPSQHPPTLPLEHSAYRCTSWLHSQAHSWHGTQTPPPSDPQWPSSHARLPSSQPGLCGGPIISHFFPHPLPGVPSPFTIQCTGQSPLHPPPYRSCFLAAPISLNYYSHYIINLRAVGFLLFPCLPQEHICFSCPGTIAKSGWQPQQMLTELNSFSSYFKWSQRNNSLVIFSLGTKEFYYPAFCKLYKISNITLNHATAFPIILWMILIPGWCVINCSGNTQSSSAKFVFCLYVPQMERL